jgi:hypothetical protein
MSPSTKGAASWKRDRAELRRYREIERVSLPGTIDGGDVVRAGRALYAASPRTNAAGSARCATLSPHTDAA